MDKRKLIIDTDCGSDDAMAIAMALKDENYEIVMFSTVSGNVRVKQATSNLLTVLKKVDTYYPPVYMGSDEMLKRDFVGAADTHGVDGMGDLDLVDYSLVPEEGNGIDMILKTLKENDDRSIDLITLGPLTNIAKAIMKDPDAMRRVRRVVSMAVSEKAGGNVTDYAEFNVWQDAEAFKAVVDFGFEDIMFVAWDTSLGDAVLHEEEIEKIRDLSELGKFCMDSNVALMELNHQRFHENILDMADPAAIFVALYPKNIEECRYCRLNVDLNEGERYGYVDIDYEEKHSDWPAAKLCIRLDAESYKKYIHQQLK